MAKLIDNVLDFARGRLGGSLGLARNTDEHLEPVLTQVIEELRAALPERTIEAKFELIEPINCDRGRIGQLLSNLLGNALIHGAADQPIRVQAVTTDCIFELSVANGGEPIPDAALTHLFRPFFRGAVRSSQQGLGLGLYIAAEIARAHGGTIDVSSTKGETRFAFRMPLGS